MSPQEKALSKLYVIINWWIPYEDFQLEPAVFSCFVHALASSSVKTRKQCFVWWMRTSSRSIIREYMTHMHIWDRARYCSHSYILMRRWLAKHRSWGRDLPSSGWEQWLLIHVSKHLAGVHVLQVRNYFICLCGCWEENCWWEGVCSEQTTSAPLQCVWCVMACVCARSVSPCIWALWDCSCLFIYVCAVMAACGLCSSHASVLMA